MNPSLNHLTITEASQRLQKKEISAREVTEACLAQIDRIDGNIHAFLSYDRENALRQADNADRLLKEGPDGKPLLGIPVAIKDVIAVKDQPLNCASKILGKFISPYDATVINKLKSAGAIVFGRLNMDE